MLALKSKYQQPRGRWSFSMHLDDGSLITIGPESSFNQLLTSVNDYRTRNGYSRMSAAQLEDYLCRRQGGQNCITVDGDEEAVPVVRQIAVPQRRQRKLSQGRRGCCGRSVVR